MLAVPKEMGVSISAAMPSELERSMESLIMVFHLYSEKDGDGNTLSKKELKELMKTELASFLKSQKDPAAIDTIMKDLDQNGDGKVSFEEFVSLVVGLSIACEQIYQLHTQKASAKK
uniref:Protein S100 n=2 Tax=Oncorhynchus tshawytscha TaxID=74940 RepID=A0A8C8MKW9_ONCTS